MQKYGLCWMWVGVKRATNWRVKQGLRGRYGSGGAVEVMVYFAQFQGIRGSACMANACRV